MTDKMREKRNVATNSIIFAFVQCLTMVTSTVQAMILSRELTTKEYGTYSQGLLVVNFVVPFLLLGLSNAITYFSGQKDIHVEQFVNGIITLILFTGVLGFAGIMILRKYIIMYFGNPALSHIMLLIASLPLLQNLITAFQALFIAENMAKSIAVRNAVIALAQIVIVTVGAYVCHNILVIFLLLVILNIVQVGIFWNVFREKRYTIKIAIIRASTAKQILQYALPLAFSTAVGTLTIYMDKLIIGRLMGVEDFALYSIVSKELPFSFIISSFTTVILPVFIKKHADGYDRELRQIWKDYLKLGYTITWIFCGAAIFCSRDLLLFLYSDKYVQGLSIFIVYLIVTFFRFSYFGIILSAFGKTRLILLTAILALLINFVLNTVFFHFWGMIGPAIASLVSIAMTQVLQILFSCKLLKCKFYEIFDLKHVLLIIFEIIVVGVVVSKLRSLMEVKAIVGLIVGGVSFMLALYVLNRKTIQKLMKSLNNL